MTEPDTMTYIRAGSCVRTCSSIRIYVWPDATVCVVRCVRTHFTNRGMYQNVDNAVVSFLGAGLVLTHSHAAKKTLMFSKKTLMFLKNITIFFKKPGMFLCKGRWNHPHQVGHSFFSVHPYILAKTHYQSIV